MEIYWPFREKLRINDKVVENSDTEIVEGGTNMLRKPVERDKNKKTGKKVITRSQENREAIMQGRTRNQEKEQKTMRIEKFERTRHSRKLERWMNKNP